MKIITPFILLCALVLPAQAAIEAYQFSDEATEAEYKELIKELRCLVCQNQNLADSDADLAKDLRQQTYDMIQEGASDDEIVDYMVARYGDFVLYRPQFKSSTYLLWLGPFLLLVVVLVIVVRRLRAAAKPVEVDAAALDDAKQLLEQDAPKK